MYGEVQTHDSNAETEQNTKGEWGKRQQILSM